MFFEKPKKSNRTRDYYRFHRKRVIKNKMFILEHILFFDKRFINSNRVGQLHKGKVHCSCKICRYEQHMGLDKFKYVNKNKWLEEDIKNYLYE